MTPVSDLAAVRAARDAEALAGALGRLANTRAETLASAARDAEAHRRAVAAGHPSVAHKEEGQVMSDIQERTIAEIIGWPGRPYGNDMAEAWHRPNVDDLLAWLNGQLFHMWFEVYGDPAALPEAWDVYVNYKRVVSYGDERDEFFQACAPTLLDAFERIVRQVAARCSTCSGKGFVLASDWYGDDWTGRTDADIPCPDCGHA